MGKCKTLTESAVKGLIGLTCIQDDNLSANFSQKTFAKTFYTL